MGIIGQFYKAIKTKLRDQVGTISGLSQSDILREYLKIPMNNQDGLKRDEETFYKTVWP